MNYFINNIHINKLFHLNNFDIPIANPKFPHLIITGKNGSGKTVLLNAVAEYFETIRQTGEVKSKDFDRVLPQVEDLDGILDNYQHDRFVFAFYQADRKVKMSEPKSPTKPELEKKVGVREVVTKEFLNFLSDLKIQEALARNDNKIEDANEINQWFSGFEKILTRIFQDADLHLEFNYRDYSFNICTGGKKFKFTEMSDGFAAAIDIVADLILKMQNGDRLVRNYEKEGIVLIDEIETHLHLALQKVIMPLLTTIFPNIQFIVTTHSPFVLSSMPNAVAYDLEHQEVLDDLTEYSYESLAEGYFGVNSQSSYSAVQLTSLERLLSKETWSDVDRVEVKQLLSEFARINQMVSPALYGKLQQIKIRYAEKIKSL